MAITVINLIALGITLFALKLVIVFKIIDFAYRRWIARGAGRADGSRGRSAAEAILRERFASGEINDEELRRMSAVLSSR